MKLGTMAELFACLIRGSEVSFETTMRVTSLHFTLDKRKCMHAMLAMHSIADYVSGSFHSAERWHLQWRLSGYTMQLLPPSAAQSTMKVRTSAVPFACSSLAVELLAHLCNEVPSGILLGTQCRFQRCFVQTPEDVLYSTFCLLKLRSEVFGSRELLQWSFAPTCYLSTRCRLSHGGRDRGLLAWDRFFKDPGVGPIIGKAPHGDQGSQRWLGKVDTHSGGAGHR